MMTMPIIKEALISFNLDYLSNVISLEQFGNVHYIQCSNLKKNKN